MQQACYQCLALQVILWGGTVIYTIKSRLAFLDLDRERIKQLKPLTEEMALEFARAARAKLDTTWGIAELGGGRAGRHSLQ